MGYPNVESYQMAAHAWGVDDRVTFTGRVPFANAPYYLAAADIAVAPKLSTSEGSGKLLNYMAMAQPIVAYDLSLIHILRRAGYNDADLWAAALLHDVGKTRWPLSAWDRTVIVVGAVLFPGRVEPVSYTHLDVYKRQPLGTAHDLSTPSTASRTS